MNKLLIIYPHWYPSNLAGVHRPRLTGNYLFEKGWQPIILTVKPDYYEEKPDADMHRLFSPNFKEYRVDALKVRKPRIIGDIGLRAFYQLYKKGKEIIRTEKPDFLWIPIPSFYAALLGRLLHASTTIPYGIDYIDPWVRDISKDGSLRARISLWVAKFLEPIAIKKASLITGVAFEYYKPVLERNFKISSKNQEQVTTNLSDRSHEKQLNEIDNSNLFQTTPPSKGAGGCIANLEPDFDQAQSPNLEPQTCNLQPVTTIPHFQINHVSFPYGFDPRDHEISIPDLTLPWDDRPGCIPVVYAGAFMPNSQYFMGIFFKALAHMVNEGTLDKPYHFYFLGTGNYPHKLITAYAADYGVGEYVTEIRDRFPFLHILNYLAKADRLLIIGSTEQHYTASKTFQVILSKRPFMGMFHHMSTAVDILAETNTNAYLVKYEAMDMEQQLLNDTLETLHRFLNPQTENWVPNLSALSPYSSERSAEILARAMEEVLGSK